MSTLLKYFNYTKTEGSSLPDFSGPLSKKVPATSIEETNKEMDACSSRNSNGGKRRAPYAIVTPEQKARVGKHAAENGTANTIRHFSKDMPNFANNRSPHILESTYATFHANFHLLRYSQFFAKKIT